MFLYSFGGHIFILLCMNGKFWGVTDIVIFTLLGSSYFLISINILFFFLSLRLFGAAPMAYRGSQARGLVGVVATGLHQSHSNSGSEPCLRPTPQLTATPDP